MRTYNNISELTRDLQRGSKLLNDMFIKRKTVSVRYDDALETLDGSEERLKHLIEYGVIVSSGDTLELDDAYLRFFEDVLAVNEDINDAWIKTYIDKVTLGINSYLAADNSGKRSQLLREIRHSFYSIANATRRNVVDLKRNVEQTYKQEPNFKIKSLRLHYFDDKAKLISELIRQTEKVIDGQSIFFANATDFGIRQTIVDVKDALHESSHSLISISAQIIDYLNRIEYQNQLVRKIRKLKYMRDQLMIEESTDIKSVLAAANDLWMEKRPKYYTKVSLDFLRNEDSSLEILDSIRKRLARKTSVKSRLAGKIDESYLTESHEISKMFNHREIMNGFQAQSTDLFSYIWNYHFEMETGKEMRLVLFLQLASQYDENLRFTGDMKILDNVEYPLIYSK